MWSRTPPCSLHRAIIRGDSMKNTSFVLSTYDKIKLKTQDKTILILHCIFNKRVFVPLFLDYTEMNEAFCNNNLNEDITQYVDFRYSNDKGFVAYIKI